MPFDQWVRKKVINKVVDPGMGVGTAGTLDNPAVIGVERTVTETNRSTQLADTINLAEEVATLAKETIAEIVAANLDDPRIVSYNELVKRTLWDPSEVFLAPEKPLPDSLIDEIKAAEKEILLNSKDPRASFLNDLAHIGMETEQLKYSLENYWKRITDPTELYDYVDDTSLGQYNLDKTNQQLNVMKEQVNRVKNNKFAQIGLTLTYALSSRILTQLYSVGFAQAKQELYKVIKLLQSLKMLVEWGLILQSTKWEELGNILRDLFSGELSNMVHQMMAAQAYALAEGVQERVFSFTDSLERDFGDVLGLLDSDTMFPEVAQFNSLIGSVLLDNTRAIEDHMVRTEGRLLKFEEQRRKQIEISQNASKIKQLRDLLGNMISYLRSLQNLEGITTGEYLEELTKLMESTYGVGAVTQLNQKTQ